MQECSLIDLLMERDEVSRKDAEEIIHEYRDLVLDKEMTLEEALHHLGVEPDYAFELLSI